MKKYKEFINESKIRLKRTKYEPYHFIIVPVYKEEEVNKINNYLISVGCNNFYIDILLEEIKKHPLCFVFGSEMNCQSSDIIMNTDFYMKNYHEIVNVNDFINNSKYITEIDTDNKNIITDPWGEEDWEDKNDQYWEIGSGNIPKKSSM